MAHTRQNDRWTIRWASFGLKTVLCTQAQFALIHGSLQMGWCKTFSVFHQYSQLTLMPSTPLWPSLLYF